MSGDDFTNPINETNEALLTRACDGDAQAQEILFQQLQTRVLIWCRKCAGDLPSDLHDDVVQETLLMFHRDISKFDPQRGSVASFLFGLYRNALRKVGRTSFDPVEGPISYLGMDAPVSGLTVADLVADHHNDSEPSADALHTREVVRQIVDLARVDAPKVIRDAINLLASGRCESMSAVARELGVNRITMTRRLRAWGAKYEYHVAA